MSQSPAHLMETSRFSLCLARADCRQPASLTLVNLCFFLCHLDNVSPHRDDGCIFHQQQNKTMFWVAISKYVFKCSCSSQERQFLVSWQCAWSSTVAESRGKWSMCHHPTCFSLPSDSESHCIGWMVNDQGNLFGLIKRGFKTESTLSFPRVNMY